MKQRPITLTSYAVDVALLGNTRRRQAQLMALFGVPFHVAYRILVLNLRRA